MHRSPFLCAKQEREKDQFDDLGGVLVDVHGQLLSECHPGLALAAHNRVGPGVFPVEPPGTGVAPKDISPAIAALGV